MRQYAGRQLAGRYQIEEYIAEGNFGAVYLGRQLFLDDPVRRVAVKLSKATGLDRDTAKELFADAYRLAEAMDEVLDAESRKHLIHVLDLGIADDLGQRGYAILEFVQGTDLAKEFASFAGPVPSNIVENRVRQACRGLDGLHRMVPPLLHCDLKPDNILLGADSTVRLVDFGLSRRLLHTGRAQAGQGVVKYMAPEASQLQECTPASDVYTLGVVMYEGLTGKLPFDHLIPPLNLPHAVFNNWFDEQREKIRVIPPSDSNSSVSSRLNEIVVRCLQYEPLKRYRDAGELLKALEEPEDGKTSRSAEALRLSHEHRRLQQYTEAERAVRSALADAHATATTEEVYELRSELAHSLTALRLHEDAAACLVEAWNGIENSAVLRETSQRMQLLRRIVQSYAATDNPFQANRWRQRLEKMQPDSDEKT